MCGLSRELEQLDEELRSLRKRVSKARRAAKTGHWIHWAHVGDVKHLNYVLTEQVEPWQPRYDEPQFNTRTKSQA